VVVGCGEGCTFFGRPTGLPPHSRLRRGLPTLPFLTGAPLLPAAAAAAAATLDDFTILCQSDSQTGEPDSK